MDGSRAQFNVLCPYSELIMVPFCYLFFFQVLGDKNERLA